MLSENKTKRFICNNYDLGYLKWTKLTCIGNI